ncbi:nucleotide sugar dehydrogenase [Dongia soli]|uniref:Nucleotide sugar dehydrogenase n=1 Tax=Dongia soli TaxID=600628 RepID=A0ABU5EFK1_9PROT|nr:nucleotide sugar dehydrogenase [Dongia soli]MDY0884300.1 nucleotide sugar dehydrogenase [Dongia soli]
MKAQSRPKSNSLAVRVTAAIRAQESRIGIIGLGYVGLPLACLFAECGFAVTGFDIDPAKIRQLSAGKSYIKHIGNRRIAPLVKAGTLAASDDFSGLAAMDVIVICVPTPLTKHREPDLQFIVKTGETIARQLRRGQLVVLESSTYPGTTRDVLKPILERTGLKSGRDFFLAYSPEREDPGNTAFGTAAIPKVVGGDGAAALKLATSLYDRIVIRTVPVSSPETAETIKLTENIFRAVNIALVNELKVICMAMDVDVWEVIDGAKSKPFGFMPFYPGPGLGGHCIPIDPFYLTWKAREYGINTRFIELAGEINTAMPHFVIERLTHALSAQLGKALKGARILVLGVAYKKNVDDLRESPSLHIMEELERRGARVSYHDPLIPKITPTREYPGLTGRRSAPLTARNLASTDAVLIVTDHEAVDYALVGQKAKLIVDTRNVMAKAGIKSSKLVKA